MGEGACAVPRRKRVPCSRSTWPSGPTTTMTLATKDLDSVLPLTHIDRGDARAKSSMVVPGLDLRVAGCGSALARKV